MKKNLLNVLCLTLLSIYVFCGNGFGNINHVSESIREANNETETSLRNVKKAIVLDEINDVYDSGNVATELCSKLGVQTGVSVEGKKCMRFIVAVRDLNVSVKLNRQIIKENGNITKKSYTIENAYSAIKVKGNLIEPSSFNKQCAGADYKYFITYSVNGITEDRGVISANVIVSDLNEENPLDTVTNYNVADYAGASADYLKAENGENVTINGTTYTYKDGKVVVNSISANGSIKIAPVTVQTSNLSSDAKVYDTILLDPSIANGVTSSVTFFIDQNMSIEDFVNSNSSVLSSFPNNTLIRIDDGKGNGNTVGYRVENGKIVLKWQGKN